METQTKMMGYFIALKIHNCSSIIYIDQSDMCNIFAHTKFSVSILIKGK